MMNARITRSCIRARKRKSKHLRQQILDTNRQFTHADAGGVVDCVGDGRGDAGEADLADPARA